MIKLITPDEEIELGNPLTLMTSWAELARACGDADKEYANLLYVPFTDEERVPAEVVAGMKAQAALALSKHADELSEHTLWCLRRIAGSEQHAYNPDRDTKNADWPKRTADKVSDFAEA